LLIQLFDDHCRQDEWREVLRLICGQIDEMHSEFGRILPTRNLDGMGPYLDPLQPISRDHILKAAEKAKLRPEDIDAQVASLSAHLGWDVTRGARPAGQEKVGKKRTRKKKP
jgi:hypothetical protein